MADIHNLEPIVTATNDNIVETGLHLSHTSPTNSDFDGNEHDAWNPQDVEVKAEAEILLNVNPEQELPLDVNLEQEQTTVEATEPTINNDDDKIILSILTDAYVDSLIGPYVDALEQADSKEGLLQWLPLVFDGEYLENILPVVDKTEDVDAARNAIIHFMKDALINKAQATAGKFLTPWDIALARDTQLEKLFGEAVKELPIQVTVGPNVYTHKLSQDIVFGILLILDNNEQFTITLNGNRVHLEELQLKYNNLKDAEGVAYKATLLQGSVFFNSPDVVQGIMTAAQWIKADPHTLVKDLNGFMDGNWVSLGF